MALGHSRKLPRNTAPLRCLVVALGRLWTGKTGACGHREKDGYEIVDGGLALSGPRYYTLFHDAVTEWFRSMA